MYWQFPPAATELLLLAGADELGTELLLIALLMTLLVLATLLMLTLLVLRLLDEAGRDELLDEAGRDEEERTELAVAPTTPKGAGCAAQVVRLTQLLLPSQPQPVWVVTHSGYTLPYQLHCDPLLA